MLKLLDYQCTELMKKQIDTSERLFLDNPTMDGGLVPTAFVGRSDRYLIAWS